MLGIQFIKFQPNVYVLKYQRGKIVAEGAGLAFLYYAPTTSLVAIPISSAEAPFIFEATTRDFQSITVQGQVTFRIQDIKKIAELLNYTLDRTGKQYVSNDAEQLPQRIINIVQVLINKEVSALPLKEALKASETLAQTLRATLKSQSEIASLGIDVLGVAILAIAPNKETARALEAEAREQILKEADDAIYTRRNAAVEQERTIKENELNTEIAVERKKREIQETQMEARRAIQEKQHRLEADRLQFNITQEEQKKTLVQLAVANAKAEADAKAYALAAMMQVFEKVAPATIHALATVGMSPETLIASAFQGLAEKAEKIGQLNVSPDLLKELLHQPPHDGTSHRK